jgi:hypothetical protein
LETTATLGPHFATATSPKTGEPIVTFASEDKSFEFHVKPTQVSKITFSKVEKGDNKTMRICRFVNQEGGPISSLILQASGKDDDKSADWFDGMIQQYGTEATF